MADNVTLNAGSGGDVIATEDIGGVEYQRIKIADGDATSTGMLKVAAVDEAAGGSDTGLVALAVRDDALTTLTAIDGDYERLRVDSTGALWVRAAGLATDDTTTHSSGSSLGSLIMGAATPTDGSVDANDIGAVAMSTDRRLHTDAQIVGQDADITIADGGNSITVDGTVTANLSATDNTVLDNIDSNTDFGAVTGGGVEASALRVTIANDSTGVVSVDDGGGSITIDGTVTANAGTGTMTVDLGSNNDVTVTGGNAHDGTTLGNPVLGGARATNSIEGLTQVANADLTHLQADLNGVLITRPYTTPEEILSERVSNTNGTSTAFTTFAAGGAGVHNYITTISIYNSSATDGYVDFRDGTAGSVIFTAAAPAAGGSVINLPVPLKGAANTALAYDVSGALSTVYISVVGYQAQG